MKKFYSILFLMLVCLTAAAQTNPNRMLVREKSGNVKGFLAERIDSIFFVKQEGRVAADITFGSYNADDQSVTVAVKRTPGCQAFRFTCLPTNSMKYLTDDAAVAAYFDSKGGDLYYDDFSEGKITGLELKDDTKYTLLTMGYDQYGIACSSSRADFATPRKPLVGNPTVEWSVKSVGTDRFTLSMKPNADVEGYAICLFKKGEAEQQFEMWGPMMGFENMGDMIKKFSGKTYTTDYEKEWTELAPGTDYEVYIQAWDVNDTYADMIIAPVTTKSQGGTGLAQVEISIGDFGTENGASYQWVTFTPNAETALFRGMLITKAAYESADWGEAKLTEYLKTDNPNDPYWDMYQTNTDRWNVDPSTDYYAFAIAKNARGEWGPLAQKAFSTPASAPAAARVNSLPRRQKRGTGTYEGQTFKLLTPKLVKRVELK